MLSKKKQYVKVWVYYAAMCIRKLEKYEYIHLNK